MEAFMDTLRRGDVAAATLALLTDPLVAQRVRDEEARIAAIGSAAFLPSSARFRLQHRFLEAPSERAWFYGAPGSTNVFFGAAATVETDVVAWLYGAKSPTAPDMTHTLGFLFYGLLIQAIQRNDLAVMEILLSSSTFVQVFSDRFRAVILGDAMARIGGENAATTISLLVSHGAQISGDDGDALPVFGSRALASATLLRHVAAEGAWFVGLKRVLHRMLVDAETLRTLLRLGIDLRDDAVVDLRGTASAGAIHQLEIIAVLLAEGIVDVDAQEDHGRFADSGTALMRTVRGLFGVRVDGVDDTQVFVGLLLRFGADARLQDRRGHSAVDYLTMSADAARFKMLSDKLLGA